MEQKYQQIYYIYGKFECEGMLVKSGQDESGMIQEVTDMLQKRYGKVDLSKLALIDKRFYEIISDYSQEKYEQGYSFGQISNDDYRYNIG